MHRRHCDMGGIHGGFARQQVCRQNFMREVLRRFGVFQHPVFRQCFFPGLGGNPVAATRFGKHQAGNEKLVMLPALIPPIMGSLLLAGNQDISAGPGGQQARNRGFEIDLWFHVATGSFASGSTHLLCSLMRSTKRSTASASGMLNLIGVLPTYKLIFPGAPPT